MTSCIMGWYYAWQPFYWKAGRIRKGSNMKTIGLLGGMSWESTLTAPEIAANATQSDAFERAGEFSERMHRVRSARRKR